MKLTVPSGLSIFCLWMRFTAYVKKTYHGGSRGARVFPNYSLPMTTKPRDVQILPIGTDTIIWRSRSWARLRFEIEYALARFTERYI
jgi:hypothetical protein